MKFSLTLVAFFGVVLLAGGGVAQVSQVEPARQTLQDIAKSQEQYFAERGTNRTGFRQYKRWEQWVMPRAYPSGELVNDTSLTWHNFFKLQRSPDYQAAHEAGEAAEIGSGNWQAVQPKDPAREGGDVGRINAVAFDPTDPKTIYAGSPGGGLWQTQDNGLTWHILTEQLPMLTVSDVAVDPAHPNTIYVLTGDGEMYVGASMGILKSTDRGKTWVNTNLVWPLDRRVYGHRLAINPKNPAIMFVASSLGLYRTTTGADGTWTRVSTPNEPGEQSTSASGYEDKGPNAFVDVLFHPGNPSIVYAATRSQVYRSMDGGQSWTLLAGGLPRVTADTPEKRNDMPRDFAANRVRLAVTPKSPDTLYVLYGSSYGFWIGLYRSDDSGNTFTKSSGSAAPPSSDARVPAVFSFSTPNILGRRMATEVTNNFDSQSDYDLAMAVSPTDANVVLVGGIDIFRSGDGGKTWTRSSNWLARGGSHYTHADIHMLAFNGNTLVVASDGGVYRSNNAGETWESIGSFKGGMQIAQPYNVCLSPKNPNVFFYGAQDNGTWKLDVKGRLVQVAGGDGLICQVDPDDPEIVYISFPNGTIAKSTQGGAPNTFTPLKVPAAGTWRTPYVLGPDPSNVYVCARDLWLGSGRGFAWKNLTSGRVGTSIFCVAVAVAPTDEKTIYVAKGEFFGTSWERAAGPARPAFLAGGGLFRTTDGGANWQNVTGTLPIADAALTDVAVSPADPRRIWVTFSGYNAKAKVFGSTDGGATWTNLSDDSLPNVPANTVVVRNDARHGIFVGFDVGVYYRDDVVGRWIPFFDNLPYSSVQSLIVDEKNKRIVAALFGRGIWQSPLPELCATNCTTPSPRPSRALEPAAAPHGVYRGAVNIFEAAGAQR